MNIQYGKHDVTDEDIAAVSEVLRSDLLTQGPTSVVFEDNFSKYVGAEYSIAVSNGTQALQMAVRALGLKKGQRVITTPITFVASANCVLYEQGEVDFCDIDPETFNIDLEALEEKLKSKPKGYYTGVICVDFCGMPVNTERLKALADEYGFWIIEDACHAPGGYFVDSKNEKVKCGSNKYADLTVFSFHPVKHIAAGEGGMITTNNIEIREALKKMRSHGITKQDLSYQSVDRDTQGGWYYEMQSLGFNGRITDFQCALGNSQLKRAADNVLKRAEIADKYISAFKNEAIECQKVLPNSFNAYHLFVVKVENRKGLYEFLQSQGVYPQIHYIPIHLMPYYADLGFKKGDFPQAESYYESCLSLPMYPTFTQEEQDFVIDKVKEFCK